MRRLLVCFLPFLASACATFSKDYPEKTLYVLDARRGEFIAAETDAPTLFVQAFRPGPLLQGRELVYRTAPSVFEADYYHEFFAAPEALVTRATVAWLIDSGLYASVAAGAVDASPDHVLQGSLEALYVDLTASDGPLAVLEARLFVTRREEGRAVPVWSGELLVSEPAASARGEDVLAAWNAALRRMLTRLERELRAARSAGV